mmetsp:Transcript_144864/g.464324  ORF Transcript_144864/g.464324 Transcript_144864/m.464324 type:complete len:221 (-) Transcript_144864:3-665(-)
MGTHRRQSSGRSPRPGRQRAPLALQLPALEAGMSPGQPPGCHPGRFRWCGPADCRAAGAALQRRQQTKIAPRVASVGVLPVEQQRIESPKRRSSRCSAGLSAQPARDASSGACGTKVPPKMQYGSLLTCDASESETRIRSHPTPLTFGRKVTTVAAPQSSPSTPRWDPAATLRQQKRAVHLQTPAQGARQRTRTRSALLSVRPAMCERAEWAHAGITEFT